MLIIIVSRAVHVLKKFHTKNINHDNKTYIVNVKCLVSHSYKLVKQQVFNSHQDLCTIWNAISENMSKKEGPLHVQGEDNIGE